MSFKELAENKPTMDWIQRMEEDDIFTDENIDETNKILDAYIAGLEKLEGKKSEEKILQCVKEAVIGLNELNDTYDYFIETLEREELCEFITEAANIAGLESEEDITEEWREW